ncbi:hypothetical protein P389DRAFT_207902 [Cystobasidium minutum MCA 4210]|uniref:uncharacterized protein n=1 Tax=Cystobasidium minutum MCA 4210 TaxID=1397322 RepID=UPI0034CE9664|eukprot:jgi/Rhomi1/207902/estExt_Genemark1.C_1_t20385
MASRLVGLTALRRTVAAPALRLQPVSTRMTSMNMTARRGMHASSVWKAEKESTKHKKGLYTDPEILPLYAIVILAVSAGLYMGSKHLFTDNDIRRAPEYPVDAHGNYDDKPQKRPEWKPVAKKGEHESK